MSAIILDGSIVHYEALGRGRPIVFLHGWVGSWRYWVNAMQVASTSYRSYAMDLFGFGDTAHESQYYPIENQADALHRFLGEMGIGKIAIVGHDLGALVGMSFIRKWPQDVDRMMAVGCPFDLESVNQRLMTSPMNELVDWLSGRDPERMSTLADASKADPLAIPASIKDTSPSTLLAEIRGLGIPCLFANGAASSAVAVPSQQRVESLPGHMHQITLEGTGHFPMLENPNQFNRLMTDFFALESGTSPRELQLKEEWKRRVR